MRASLLLSVFFVTILPLPSRTRGAESKLELVVQTGHTSDVTSVSLSADGKLLATGSTDHTAILWDALTGRALRTFAGHTNDVDSVSLSADGMQLATGSTDHTAILWDTQTGKKLQSFKAGIVKSLSLSSDGKLLSTASFSEAILWDTQTGKQLQEFKLKTNCESISLSSNGKFLATGLRGLNEPTILWDTQTGKQLREFNEDCWSSRVSLSADGKLLATGSLGTASLWDTQTGKKIQSFKGHEREGAIKTVCLSQNGRFLATGLDDHTVKLWDTQTAKKLRTLDGHTSWVVSVSLSGDGKLLASGSSDKTTILWDFQTGKKLHSLHRHTNDRAEMSLIADGTLLATGTGYDEEPIVRDAKREKDPQREWAALWDAQTGKKLQSFKESYLGSVKSICLSADRKFLATGSNQETAVLWDTSTGKQLKTFKLQQDTESVGLSGDGKLLATTFRDKSLSRKVIVWDTQGEQRIQSLTLDTGGFDVCLALSGDGKWLATASYNTTILWDPRTGRQIKSVQVGNDSSVTCVSLSADGKYLSTGFLNHAAILWDTQTGKKLQTFQGHTSAISSVSLSDDAKLFFTGSSDGTTRIWDSKTGKGLCSRFRFDKGKEWLVVTPDGYFDGSENAAKLISYRIAGTLEFVPLERYRKQFERPGLLAMIMKGEDYHGNAVVKQDLPPTVKITSPMMNSESRDGKFTINAEAQSRGEYPVSSFRLKVNGKPYFKNQGLFQVDDPKLGKAAATWDIELEPGRHNLEVLAYTQAVFNVSDHVEVRYVGGGAPPQNGLPTLYILSVGISKYPKESLDFAHRDATEIAKAYQSHSKALFKKIEVNLLTDEKANRDAILEGLEWLRKNTTQKDFAVFFFAGHGVKDQRDKFYLLPIDGDREKLTRTAIDGTIISDELVSIPGQLLVILDACHSGTIGGNKNRGLTENLLKDLSSEEKGVAIMCSATGRELAQESRTHEHGMFTIALLEAIRGKGNEQNGPDILKVRLTDGAVYFKQLDSYVTDRVKQLSKGYQHPVTSVPRNFRDFPVSKP